MKKEYQENGKKFSEAMGELDNRYIEEAMYYQKKTSKELTILKSVWVKRGSLAACFCLVIAAAFWAIHFMQPSHVSEELPQASSIANSGIQPRGDGVDNGDVPSRDGSDGNMTEQSQDSSNGNTDVQSQGDSSAQGEKVKQVAQDVVMDKTMTWEKAKGSKPFGDYLLSEVPSGFTVEKIQRYQDGKANYLSGLWAGGENSFGEISWRVSFYEEAMENRMTSVQDTRNYDLSLYPLPLADSVPEELFAVVDNPIFRIEELTVKAVRRRAYSAGESGDEDIIRMSFGVRYGDVVVEVTAKGVSPKWLYQQLTKAAVGD